MDRKILYLLFILFMSSCSLGLSTKENLFGNYYLVAADTDKELCLSYHEPTDGDNYGTVIEPKVFAIGYNEKYIIAKQHPFVLAKEPLKSITVYFILPLNGGFNWGTKNGLIGPLTLEQFNEKEIELNISPNLKFTIEK